METIKLLMQILKCGVTGGYEISLSNLSDADLQELYSISQKHDLAHLVGHVLQKNNLLNLQTEIGQKFNKQMMLAVYRTTRIEYDYKQICQIFDNANIPYIPLKGAVIRSLYPESWLRTSCDIDILVKQENLEQACSVLVENGNTKQREPEFHCVNFTTGSGVHLELHFTLSEREDKINAVLDKVWDYASLKDGYSYALTNEFIIFYAVEHIAYHLSNGGCGIRTILDLWLMLNTLSFNEKLLSDMLMQAGHERFYKSIVKLAKVWFEGEKADELTDNLQSFILTGGVYGTKSNKMDVSIAQKQSKLKYIFVRFLPPYSTMKVLYPTLAKHPILLPFFWIGRIFKLIFKRDAAKKAVSEVKTMQNVSKNDVDEISKLFEDLGLG